MVRARATLSQETPQKQHRAEAGVTRAADGGAHRCHLAWQRRRCQSQRRQERISCRRTGSDGDTGLCLGRFFLSSFPI